MATIHKMDFDPQVLPAFEHALKLFERDYRMRFDAAKARMEAKVSDPSIEDYEDPISHLHLELPEPGEMESDYENAVAALAMLREELRGCQTRAQQRSALFSVARQTLEEVLYGGNTIGSYELVTSFYYHLGANLHERYQIPAVTHAERLRRGVENDVITSDITPYLGIGLLSCQALNAMCVALQIGDGIPEDECAPSVYDLAVDEFHVRHPVRANAELTEKDINEIWNISREVVQALLEPFAQAFPNRIRPELAWFLLHEARADCYDIDEDGELLMVPPDAVTKPAAPVPANDGDRTRFIDWVYHPLFSQRVCERLSQLFVAHANLGDDTPEFMRAVEIYRGNAPAPAPAMAR